jgi:ribosomal protein L37AE/L43A
MHQSDAHHRRYLASNKSLAPPDGTIERELSSALDNNNMPYCCGICKCFSPKERKIRTNGWECRRCKLRLGGMAHTKTQRHEVYVVWFFGRKQRVWANAEKNRNMDGSTGYEGELRWLVDW